MCSTSLIEQQVLATVRRWVLGPAPLGAEADCDLEVGEIETLGDAYELALWVVE